VPWPLSFDATRSASHIDYIWLRMREHGSRRDSEHRSLVDSERSSLADSERSSLGDSEHSSLLIICHAVSDDPGHAMMCEWGSLHACWVKH